MIGRGGGGGHGNRLFPKTEAHDPFHLSAGQKQVQCQTGPGPVPCGFWALSSGPCPQTRNQEGLRPVLNPLRPALWKNLHLFSSCCLSPEISPIHPNHDIKFPSWPQGVGKFQGDRSTTWKITARRKTVLDPTSDTTRELLFFLIWGLAAASAQNPRKSSIQVPQMASLVLQSLGPGGRALLFPSSHPEQSCGSAPGPGTPRACLPSSAQPTTGHSANLPPPGRPRPEFLP